MSNLSEAFCKLNLSAAVEEDDCSIGRYGQIEAQFGTIRYEGALNEWTSIGKLNPDKSVGSRVMLRARLHQCRGTAKHAFLVLRDRSDTMQAIVSSETAGVSKAMVKFVAGINRESVIDLEGVIVKANVKSEFITQKTIELQADRVYVVSAATSSQLPFNLDDAARAEEASGQEEKPLPRVTLETRLNNRVIDLRTTTNQAIFRVQAGVGRLFREYLESLAFVEIHSPKLISAASEGGANVFRVQYFKTEAFLAQSPQFYKQMAICADMDRVYEIAPVFRAENSFTHRHMTEFMGLDLEMAIRQDYHEVVNTIAGMFNFIFGGLEERYAQELALIRQQYPAPALRFLKEPLILQYSQAVELLRADGVEMEDFEDLSTEKERRLGQLVAAKYATDFFVLDKFPLSIRPFYTMPDPSMPGYSNSYDFFIRGEEVMSGAQRVHDPVMLEERARAHGIDPLTIEPYLEAFRYGAPPHAGGGIGLERVVMLYLDLKNIRKTSLFPRDPHRITP